MYTVVQILMQRKQYVYGSANGIAKTKSQCKLNNVNTKSEYVDKNLNNVAAN